MRITVKEGFTAIKLEKAEKRTLRKTLGLLKAMITHLPSGVYSSGDDIITTLTEIVNHFDKEE